MKFVLSLSILFTVLQIAKGLSRRQLGIQDLDKTNFQAAIANNPYILVEFYAPWCYHCREFAPEYEEVAKIIQEKNVPIQIAKVDAISEKNIANEQGIEGYPTVKLFKNGYPLKYNGQRQADDIFRWLLMNTDQ